MSALNCGCPAAVRYFECCSLASGCAAIGGFLLPGVVVVLLALFHVVGFQDLVCGSVVRMTSELFHHLVARVFCLKTQVVETSIGCVVALSHQRQADRQHSP
eukprot:5713102-Amphidinium_carterae.1